jgi:hypothetical protein
MLLLSALVLAAALDGTYTGTLSCPAFPNQPPLCSQIKVTVTDRTATYEQVAPGAATEAISAYESGNGTVSASGEIMLTGGCRGGFSCVTEYRGRLSGTPIRLKGSQRWWFRSGERERPCEIELTRAGPSAS